jgi:predicted Rossmann fold flavoprotein
MVELVVIGGGAAGFFGAVTAAKGNRSGKVILLEKSAVGLSKVRISGGGRCNVTHACFDPLELVKNYPRGGKELLGPFHRFQPKNTIEWFLERGVTLKVEEDGRMFPVTDNSETIIECLQEEIKKTGVEIRWKQSIKEIKKTGDRFDIFFTTGEKLECDKILLTTGSSKEGHALAEGLGHTIVSTVPSLFTFNIPGSPLNELAGISVNPVILKIEGTNLKQQGPLLITHWGFSGPAALKLSAWGARILHEKGYEAQLLVNWLPKYSQESLIAHFSQIKKEHANQSIGQINSSTIAKQLWKLLLSRAEIDSTLKLKDIPNKKLSQFAGIIQTDRYNIVGKTTYKQEFVTSGGVSLDEVNFKTMESKKCSGLYFAGEVLNIDAVTGGFNFQNAWTTSWIAGTTIAL